MIFPVRKKKHYVLFPLMGVGNNGHIGHEGGD